MPVFDYSDSAAAVKEFGDGKARAEMLEIGGKKAMKITLKPGFDWPSMAGAHMPGCPKWCPATHFGFLQKGCMKVTYEDGKVETINAGEQYLVPPGHIPSVEEETVMVEFSESTAAVIDTMKK